MKILIKLTKINKIKLANYNKRQTKLKNMIFSNLMFKWN